MKAFVVTAPKTFEIQEVAEPKAGVGEIVVEQGGDKALADTAFVLGKENDSFGGHG